MGTGRIRRGWRMAKKSWAVLRGEGALVVFPLLSGVTIITAGALLFAGAYGAYDAAGDAEWAAVVVAVPAIYVLTFLGVFFNAALAAAVMAGLRGERVSVGGGLRAAAARTHTIAAWAGVVLVVGAIMSAIESLLDRTPLGDIASALLNVAWSVATFFVVPIIALEGRGPIESLKESVRVVRERWGEGLAGAAFVAAPVVLIALVAVAALGGGAVAVAESSEGAAIALGAAAAVVLLAAIVLGSVLQAIFRVVLLAFARGQGALAGFDEDELTQAFRPKRLRGGRI